MRFLSHPAGTIDTRYQLVTAARRPALAGLGNAQRFKIRMGELALSIGGFLAFAVMDGKALDRDLVDQLTDAVTVPFFDLLGLEGRAELAHAVHEKMNIVLEGLMAEKNGVSREAWDHAMVEIFQLLERECPELSPDRKWG